MSVYLKTTALALALSVAGLPARAQDSRTAKSAKPAAKPAVKVSEALPKSGIKKPGVLIPFSRLKAEAEIAGAPSWITVTDTLLVPAASGDAIERIDLKTGQKRESLAGVKQACAGAVTAFKSLWVSDCATGSITRMEPKSGKVEATLNIGAGKVRSGLVATSDSVWAMTDNKTTLSRIDPDSNSVVGEVRIAASCNAMLFAEQSIWVVCPMEDELLRVNPLTNLVEQRIKVAAKPTSVASGDGSMWVLGLKEGKIDRIDPKTNKVVKTIELNVPDATEGSLAYGENALWATATGFPLMRIDTTADKEAVMQQFWGDGGGLVLTASGAVWLTNPKDSKLLKLDPKRITATLAE
jgi:virginiamycin B lyase